MSDRMLSLIGSHQLARAALIALAVTGLATTASATQLSCQGGALTLDVDVNPSAGTCEIDGQRAALRKPHNPVVCHVSKPHLRILTIGSDGSFTLEETFNGRILQGRCIRG